jgi:monoterpene epsilon-lactone hydrolase
LTPLEALQFHDGPAKVLIKTRTEGIIKTLQGMLEKFGVKSEQEMIAGVSCYILTPDTMPEQNRNRLLVHMHGGRPS